MATTQLAPLIKFRQFTNNGAPLAGGMIWTYAAGTNTPLQTFTDQTGATPNSNPVVLDANGYAPIWLSSAGYKFIVQDSLGNQLYTTDQIYAVNPGSITKDKLGSNVAGVALLQNTGANAGALDVQVDGASIVVNGSNQLGIPAGGVTTAMINQSSAMEVVIKMIRDQSANGGVFEAIPQFSWTAPNALTAPPIGAVSSVAAVEFSPNGEFLAAPSSATPFINLWQRLGSTFSALANPATLPGGNTFCLSFSGDGDFLCVVCNNVTAIVIYQRSGSSFVALAAPTYTLPGHGLNSASCKFSPNSDFLAVGFFDAPSSTFVMFSRVSTTFTDITSTSTITGVSAGAWLAWSSDSQYFVTAAAVGGLLVYKRAGNVFTSITPPVVTSVGNPLKWAFSPNMQYFTVVGDASPFVANYTFNKATGAFVLIGVNPNVLPAGAPTAVEWSLNSKNLAVADATTSPYLTIYTVAGTGVLTTFTKQAAPAVAPGATITGLSFSATNQFLATALSGSPFIGVYQTNSTLPAPALLYTNQVINA